MPNKTLYIRDEDLPVWEEADRHAKANGQSVSQLATQALRSRLPGGAAPFNVLVLSEDNIDATIDGPSQGHLRYEPQGDGIPAWRLFYLDEDGKTDTEIIGVGIHRDDHGRAIAAAQEFLRGYRLEDSRDLDEIVVETGDDYEVNEGFIGRWLVAPESDETRTGEPGWDAGLFWGIAQTKRGQIAVYTAHCNQRTGGKLSVYRTLDDAEKDVPADILAQAWDALGVKRVIWRDI